MMPTPEAVTPEHPRPRAVVYLYSQTGQLREVADALTAPLVARGWEVRWVPVQPRVAFPFPWPIIPPARHPAQSLLRVERRRLDVSNVIRIVNEPLGSPLCCSRRSLCIAFASSSVACGSE
jgi:hypothetical protein